MRTKVLFAALLLSATTAFAQQEKLGSGIDKTNMDLTIKPGNDFYRYAAGNWMKNHPLDAEHTDNGAFTDLFEQNQKRIQDIILEYASKPQQKGSLGQKIGSLYNLRMDSVRLNKEGWAPIKPTLDRIAAIKDRREYQLVTAQLDFRGEGTMMYGIGVGADLRDAANNLVEVGQSGLGLGVRDYYVNDDEQTKKIRDAYKAYMKKLFQMVGNDEATAQKKMEAVMAIETRIAKASYSQVQLRDIDKNYHKMTYNQLVLDYPGIDWGNVFLASGFPAFKEICVGQPEPIHEVEKILAETSLDDLKTYAEIKVISGATSVLSDDFRAVSFELSKVMSGVQQDRPRWKRAVSTVNGVLGEAVGQMYVEKYFPAAAKERMVQLVKNLQTALGERIRNLEWMGDSTKIKAIEKLNSFYVKVSYPDKWRDYTGLNIEKDSYWANVKRATEFELDYMLSKAGKPVDRDEWGMTPQTVNAYYNPTTHEICFPAGILQYPFFDMNADDAFNYGAIGVVIGHEMTHGFDDQGRQFDKDGNLKDWWTAEDAKRFEERAQVMVNFFDSIQVLPGLNANGSLTLGENIADHGGLQVSFQAFKNATKDAPLPVKDGFTPEQRFFLSYAGVWAGNIRDEQIRLQTKSDPHSLGRWRVNGALPQIGAWYDAFGIKEGDPMYLAPEKRVSIW